MWCLKTLQTPPPSPSFRTCSLPWPILYSRPRLWLQSRRHALQAPRRAQQLQPRKYPAWSFFSASDAQALSICFRLIKNKERQVAAASGADRKQASLGTPAFTKADSEAHRQTEQLKTSARSPAPVLIAHLKDRLGDQSVFPTGLSLRWTAECR